MEQIKENNVFLNPYVIQMDKFADLLQRLSKKFLSLETYRGTLTKEEMDEMFLRVTEKVCENCKNKEVCLQDNKAKTYQMMYEILSAVEEYGAEINVELKRKLRQYCQCAPRFLRETLEHFENAKQILMLNNKIVQNRQGYAKQINGLAKVIQHTTRELDAGIFEDIYLEKKIKNRMKKKGINLKSFCSFVPLVYRKSVKEESGNLLKKY